MSPLQLEYFRRKLERLREGMVPESGSGDTSSVDSADHTGDQSDQASAETERDLAALNRARTSLLLNAVDLAMARIANATYGFCADSGEPIGLKRLEAEPTATLSVEAQERRERASGGGPTALLPRL